MATLSWEERARRAASFNEEAERYDRARPTYPPIVFDHLWRMANLDDQPSVVEVGCGTGQASRSLAERGARLTCVELGENMAAIARRNLASFPAAKVVVSKFEDWNPKGDAYDLVFASASWHWIQPQVRYFKAASVLKAGGHIAVMSSEHFYPENFDPLFIALQEVYGAVTGSQREVKVQSLPEPGAFDKSDDDHIAEMNLTGAFELPEVVRELWYIDRTADQYIDLLGTYSDHWALEPDVRRRLFQGIHKVIATGVTGSIRKHYLTTLRVAQRV